jgi:hypothetical protein
MRTHADAKEDCSSEVAPDIVPKAPWRVAEVRALGDLRLWVRFNDGLEGTVSLSGLVRSQQGGVFSALRDEAVFAQVRLEYGAVTWPGELDLAPDAMHEEIRKSGEWVLD